jgi:low affinity Fe/Cu permease
MVINLKESFRRFATSAAGIAGSIWAFILAIGVIVVWLITGPVFRFSDTWQLLINTGTTIVTFLMVFLIQNTQNRDTRALHAKLDELIVHMVGADNKLVTAEDLSEEQLNALKLHFEKLGNGESTLSRRKKTKRTKAEVR